MDMTGWQLLQIDKGLFHKLPTNNSMTLLKSLYEEYFILTVVSFLAVHLPEK